MKIGFSFGRCVRDIVKGLVDFDDVLVIQTRTRMKTRDQIPGVIADYMLEADYLQGLDREECESVAFQLWDYGVLHQPRLVSPFPHWAFGDRVWMDLAPTAVSDNPTLKSAWENYQMTLKMSA